MKETQSRSSQGSTLSPQDILLALFKHKWKILVLTLLGLGGAGAVFYKRTPLYESRAKLLVKYVLERPGFDSFEAKKDAGGRSGQEVINAEIELLTSLDLAEGVASALGPEHFLDAARTEAAGVSAPSLAAKLIRKNLEVTAEKYSNVIQVSYRHEDPGYAQEALRELVSTYLKRHLEVHRSGRAFETVAKDREGVRLALGTTEAELNKLKEENMIVSTLADTSSALEEQITANLGELRPAEASLIAQQARVKQIEEHLGVDSQDGAADAEAGGGKGAAVPLGAPILDEYRALSERIQAFRTQEMDLLRTYTERDGKVVQVRAQIQKLETQRKSLVEKHRQLFEGPVLSPALSPLGPVANLGLERAKLVELTAKVEVLKQQHDELNRRYSKLSSDRAQIERLERLMTEQYDEYRLLTTSHGKALVDQTLSPTNMPNISMLQQPSAPAKTYDERITKLMFGLAAFGIVAGVGLALFLELVMDGRIKQALEIETRLRLPLMLSIPYMGRKQRHLNLLHQETPMIEDANGATNGTELAPSDRIDASAPFSTGGFLWSYAEAIRDRLVYYFELNNLTHKPKLVAFAGLTKGAGTTTLATSVARAFAEGDTAKVLLVDMNPTGPKNKNGRKNGSSSPMGQLEVGDEPYGRNLFVATAPQRSASGGPRTLAPKNFYELMPKFRASEFDYIIFDMPPIDQTSPTLSMAGFMDQVLLVLDAENTDRARLKRAHTQLLGGKADVTCVCNMTRRHAPRWVQSEV